MNIGQIKRFHDARPFEPFTMHLTDGREFRVDHPEFMARFPDGRTIFVVTGEEAAETIDVLMITSISSVSNGGPTSSPDKN